MSGRGAASLAETQRIELAIAVALVRFAGGPGWSVGRLVDALALHGELVPRADVSRVVQSMRFAGRLSMSGWTLSATMRAKAEGVLRQAQDERDLNQDSVAARAVADSPGGVMDGVERSASAAVMADHSGVSATPHPAETPAAVAPAAGEPTNDGYHSGVRGRSRREFMARATLAALTEAADAVAPCPKNTALSVVIQGSYTEVPAVLARLKEAGLISVERDGKRRKVTIVATGRSTDWSMPDERVATGEARHLIDAKLAEDAAIAERRAATERAQAERQARALAAEQAGKVPAAIGLQAVALADRAASVGRALQDAWPDTWRLLVRLSVAQSERPMVLIDRLIREEAARAGVKTPPPRRAPDDDEDEAVMDAVMRGGDAGPVDILDEGNWQ